MPKNSDVTQEVKFWQELENELRRIDQQIQSSEAQCTLAVLRLAKRFITTTAFDQDTIGFKSASERGFQYIHSDIISLILYSQQRIII
jgi:hypothetical protein